VVSLRSRIVGRYETEIKEVEPKIRDSPRKGTLGLLQVMLQLREEGKCLTASGSLKARVADQKLCVCVFVRRRVAS
jgi:hypothetical protein